MKINIAGKEHDLSHKGRRKFDFFAFRMGSKVYLPAGPLIRGSGKRAKVDKKMYYFHCVSFVPYRGGYEHSFYKVLFTLPINRGILPPQSETVFGFLRAKKDFLDFINKFGVVTD